MQSRAPAPEPASHLAGTPAGQSPAARPVAVHSTDLFKGQKSVAIEHNGCVYRLQTTKLGKLILTK
ncbi:MAG: hemin uptake protein HemP [Rhodoferax sp.]|uniref:hemin uptake protein HemP n=1 Tax=Rhodoferax sp. TaxID=50421 RepID=UPI002715A519|nr:hemin uptake protein HemP [Rhodoferax sp.]MDO8450637.1 hemin uptake protein HemP [Rhodoferax sp.]